MALITCHECSNQVSSKAVTCPNCGAPVSEQDAFSKPSPVEELEEKKSGDKVGIAVALVIGIGIVVYWSLGRWDSVETAATKSYLKAAQPPIPPMAGEFDTMKTCMSEMAKAAGGPLKLSVDTPNEVLGHLPDGRFFGCYARETYSNGSFIHGQIEAK